MNMRAPIMDGDQYNWPGAGEAFLPGLSKFINLCFKENIDLSNKKFDKLRGLSPYYDWLLNMRAFDYSIFKTDWILEYQTSYYLKKAFKKEGMIIIPSLA